MNVVFLTELDLDTLNGAEAIRIIELSKIMIEANEAKIYLTSLRYDNVHEDVRLVQEDLPVYCLGKSIVDHRNYLLKKFVSCKQTATQVRLLIQRFGNEKEDTLFVMYDFLSSAYDEYQTIKQIKKAGFKIIAEKNELALGIAIGKRSVKNYRFLYYALVYPLQVVNAYFTDELVRMYDGVMVISSYIEKHTSRRLKKPLLKIPVLHPMIEPLLLEGKNEDPLFRIGYFGTLTVGRDLIMNLLEAVLILRQQGYDQVLLTLTGKANPAVENEISLFIRANKMQKQISLLGFLPSDELLALQQKQDVLIVLRKDNLQGKATFATKLANYMHLGKPVIASDVSDNKEYIKNGVNGFLLEDARAATVAKKIKEMMRFDKTQLQKIADKARATAHEHFYYKGYVKSMRDFMQLVMAKDNK